MRVLECGVGKLTEGREGRESGASLPSQGRVWTGAGIDGCSEAGRWGSSSGALANGGIRNPLGGYRVGPETAGGDARHGE
jgi:hypothetical protein